MYIRFSTSNPFKYRLKFLRTCYATAHRCGQLTVVCGRLSAIFLVHFFLLAEQPSAKSSRLVLNQMQSSDCLSGFPDFPAERDL